MKRQLMTAAMIGTSILAIANLATAKECSQTPHGSSIDTIDCREINNAQLGPNFCLVPDAFEVRAVKHGTSPDPWITNHPISLENVLPGMLPGGSAQSSPCNGRKIFGGSVLQIHRKTGSNKYAVEISSGPNKTTMDMEVFQDGGQDVWLYGNPAHSSMHYFVFLRDGSNPQSHNMPKFALIEAFDFSDGNCKDEAPVLHRTVKPGACTEPRAVAKDGGGLLLFETDVGGGGERH